MGLHPGFTLPPKLCCGPRSATGVPVMVLNLAPPAVSQHCSCTHARESSNHSTTGIGPVSDAVNVATVPGNTIGTPLGLMVIEYVALKSGRPITKFPSASVVAVPVKPLPVTVTTIPACGRSPASMSRVLFASQSEEHTSELQ